MEQFLTAIDSSMFMPIILIIIAFILILLFMVAFSGGELKLGPLHINWKRLVVFKHQHIKIYHMLLCSILISVVFLLVFLEIFVFGLLTPQIKIITIQTGKNCTVTVQNTKIIPVSVQRWSVENKLGNSRKEKLYLDANGLQFLAPRQKYILETCAFNFQINAHTNVGLFHNGHKQEFSVR